MITLRRFLLLSLYPYCRAIRAMNHSFDTSKFYILEAEKMKQYKKLAMLQFY